MTEQFERWWRDGGQFIPPCDRMQGEELEPFKKFAWELWSSEAMHADCRDTEAELREDLKEAEECASDAEEELDTLRARLEQAINDTGAPVADLHAAIRGILKHEAA